MPKELAVFPKHLRKPPDGIELFKEFSDTVPATTTKTVAEYQNQKDRHIDIITTIEVQPNGSLNHYYYKNGAKFFKHWGVVSREMLFEKDKFYQQLKDNPIRLEPGEVLKVDCENLSVGPLGTYVHLIGYTYFDDEKHIAEEIKEEEETVEVET